MNFRLVLKHATRLLIIGLILGAAYVQAEPIKIMPLGNSITYDNNVFENRPAELRYGYRSFLWHLLIDSGYNVDFVGSVVAGQNVLPLFDPDNEGYPGWTAAQIASNIITFLGNNPADIVLLHIGTNGLIADPSGVADILDAIDTVESNTGDQIIVILALIINRSCITDTPPCSQSATTTAFNDAVFAMAQARIASGDSLVVVDMEEDAGLDYRLAPLGDMIDNLHPADSGYALMADVWFDALQNILAVPTEPLPFVDIISPETGSFVETPFNVEFQYGNWMLSPGSTHVRLLIDGQDQGAYYSSDPITVSTIGPGAHIIKLVLANADGTYTNFFDGIKVADNLAFNQPVMASSFERSGFEASRAVDGSSSSRWSSSFSNSQWIYVDLGSIRTISRVVLSWEAAYGRQYEIQVSDNAVDWTPVYTETNGDGGIDDIPIVPSTAARYVRMQGIQRGTQYGYSLWEFEVYSASSSPAPELTSIVVSPLNATLSVGEVQAFTASGVDQYGTPFPVSASWSVDGGGTIDSGGVFTATTFGGPFTVEAQDGSVTGTATVTVADGLGNLAFNQPVMASSFERSGFEAYRAVDGSSSTRWSSAFSNNQWIYVDLGSIRTISRVVLSWEAAYGRQYEIQVSDNAVDWTPVYTETSSDGGIDDIPIVPSTAARYVRMQGIQRATQYGYSLWEFEVYSASSSPAPELTSIVVSPLNATLNVGEVQAFMASGLDQYGTPFPVSASWSVDGGGTIDSGGVFTATTFGGPFTVEAQDGSVTGTATVMVADSPAPELTSIVVSPLNATLSVGEVQAFTASGVDQYGTPFPVSASWSVDGGGTIDSGGVFTATTFGGPFTVEAQDGSVTGTATVTVADGLGNLAFNQPVMASSFERSGFEAYRAVDGSSSTRWSSAFSNNQWIYVDLGSIRTISRVVLSWEAAYGRQYEIQVSDNAVDWTPVYTETSSDGGIDDIPIVPSTAARYVRMQGIQRATQYGYSLWEFEVYSASSSPAPELTSIVVSPLNATLNVGEVQAFMASGLDQYGTPFPVSASWSVDGGGTIDSGGVFTATAFGGPFTVEAQDGSVTGTATVMVADSPAPELTSIVVSPLNATLSVGEVQAFTASGVDQYGTPFPVSASWSVDGGGTIDSGGVFTATTFGGPFTVEAQDGSVTGTATVTVADGLGNLAFNQPVMASSFERSGFEAYRAVDGSSSTRWSSAFSNNQWIYVDLGSIRTISRVVLSWEAAYGRQYEIQVSDNAVDWTPVYTETSSDGGIDDIPIVPSTAARYVRMQGIQRATRWGYSLFEFEVYE